MHTFILCLCCWFSVYSLKLSDISHYNVHKITGNIHKYLFCFILFAPKPYSFTLFLDLICLLFKTACVSRYLCKCSTGVNFSSSSEKPTLWRALVKFWLQRSYFIFFLSKFYSVIITYISSGHMRLTILFNQLVMTSHRITIDVSKCALDKHSCIFYGYKHTPS